MYSSPVRHSPPIPCGTVLPFDLHVLGLPPAFTLSQDQTLHLSFAAFRPEGLPANFLSAVVVTELPNHSLQLLA